MMDSVGKSVSNVIDERLSSPLISSFAIAWSLYNYKFFIIVFSAASVTDTFRLIREVVFPTWQVVLLNGFAIPALITALYIFVLPYPSKYVYERWSRTQKETKDIKQRWADLDLLGPADAEAMRLEIREATRKYEESEIQLERAKAQQRLTDATIRDLQSKIEEHAETALELEKGVAAKSRATDQAIAGAKEINERLVRTLSELEIMTARANLAEEALRDNAQHATVELNDKQKLLLATIGELGPIAMERIYGPGQSDRVAKQHNLDVLIDAGMVDTFEDQHDGPYAVLSKKGRAHIVESGMGDMF